MVTDILNELQYGVILCKNDGTMLYINSEASKIFNYPSGNLVNYNILSFIGEYFHDRIKLILQSPEESLLSSGRDFIFIKLIQQQSKIFKLKFKKTADNKVLLMIYDYTSSKVDRDNLIKTISQMNDSITRNNLVLKTISHLCKNFLYKDRSMLKDVLIDISTAFNLRSSAICFKNGTKHLVTCKRLHNGTYETERLDGNEIPKFANCQIWKQETEYSNSKELLFQAPCSITCAKLIYTQKESENLVVHVLKLKLNDDTVIGFLSFVEDKQFHLSKSDLEILESLSQILAYIVNNKEQIDSVTKYIKEKFSNLTAHRD